MRRQAIEAALIFACGMLVRAWLIESNPIVFGGDTILRLANRDKILLAYQLPLLQAIIYTASRVTDDLAVIRYLMALLGAGAGVGFYWMAGRVMEQKNALLAGLLFATSPFLVELSIVPYQEVPALAALSFAFFFFFAGNTAAASVFLGLGCLTRYEAWVACPVLAFAFARERAFRPGALAKAALLFGWAPLAWVLAHGGLSPAGTYVAEFAFSPARLVRYAYLGWITLKNTPPPVWVLAGFGAWELLRRGAWKNARLLTLGAFLALYLAAIFFSAHGVSPDPARYVTAREASVLLAAVVFLAGLAPYGKRGMVVLACAGILWGVWDARRIVVRDTSDARIRLSYQLARYLDATLGAGEKAVIVTKPTYIQGYLEKVGDTAHARRILASMDTSPPDYQRTAVHSRLGKERLVSLAGSDAPAEVAWAAVWSDSEAGSRAEAELLESVRELTPETVLEAGGLSVAVYRLKR